MASKSKFIAELLEADGDVITSALDNAGASGGDGEKVIYENEKQIDNNYTITTDYNAVSAGPITLADGVEVIIPTGSEWVIV